MSKRIAQVLDVSGELTGNPDFPIAVVRWCPEGDTRVGVTIVDPILDARAYNNLFGRVMTLVEATSEQAKLKAVKDIFAKELASWRSDVYDSAREIADGGNSSSNIYTRYTLQ